MRKIAKRALPTTTRAKSADRRALPARREIAAAGVTARGAETTGVVEGQVVSADEPGMVRALLAGGATIEARCPAHVDGAWLKEACRIAPVAAAFVVTRPSGRYLLWGVFPGGEHADVKCDVVIRGRMVKVDADSLQLSSRNAHLRLDPEGNVALKGRDVTSHARRVNRIKGGSIRLN